jgi:hypothetical protein
MDWWQISKYDPAYRDEAGVYQRDEWTSVSDLGRSLEGGRLDLETYLATEQAHIDAVHAFMDDAGVATLSVSRLEPARHVSSLSDYGLPDAEELASLASELREDSELSGVRLDHVLRLELREIVWCWLEAPDRFVVDVAYDYYVHVGTVAPSERAIARATELGLFVEPYHHPFFE